MSNSGFRIRAEGVSEMELTSDDLMQGILLKFKIKFNDFIRPFGHFTYCDGFRKNETDSFKTKNLNATILSPTKRLCYDIHTISARSNKPGGQ